MYEKILVPIDGSTPSEQALAEAISLARLTHGHLRLFHVVDELSFVLGAGFGIASAGYTESANREITELLEANGKRLLADAEKHVREAGIDCSTVLRTSFNGRLPEQVVAEAEGWPAQLIVLGSHGRRGVNRLFMGSDAESILRLAPVPVLLVRTSTKP